MNNRTGLYIHIPFCVRKCNYCAFLSFASDYETRAAYTEALCREIRTAGESMRESKKTADDSMELKPGIETVYFGGGTPSVMETELLAKVMETVRDSFELAADAEITIEANPGTLGTNAPAADLSDEYVILEKLKAYRKMGFNRLSMGVQSMNDERLRFLGRIHTAADVIRDVRLAREAGFDNINLDLIFSVPGETGADALRDAEEIIALGPEHISCYSLQLEENTPFYRMAESGEIREVPDEEDRDTYHRICALLRDAGYEHYEISNFAKMPDGRGRGFAYSYGDGEKSVNDRSPFRSRHNSMYWDMSDYIGAGLGASGFVNGVRYRNTADMDEYLNDRTGAERHKTADAGIDADTGTKYPSPYWPRADESHTNSAFDNISEAVFTGLRRREGITYSEAVSAYESCSSTEGREQSNSNREQSNKERFWEIYQDALREAQDYAEGGLLVINEQGLRLTERGIDISNGIMSLFV
ncbi:MAG: radical SAM family heme chaperone HemW [Mogibacterium sp.]|nr:radical SAM family heme chaperone HemW [Mogibacterium sp.]